MRAWIGGTCARTGMCIALLAISVSRAVGYNESGHFHSVALVEKETTDDGLTLGKKRIIALCAQLPDMVFELDAVQVALKAICGDYDERNWGSAAFVVVRKGIVACAVRKLGYFRNPHDMARMTTAQQLLHGLTGGSTRAVRAAATEIARQLRPKPDSSRTRLCAFGFALHLFGDAYAHQVMDGIHDRVFDTQLGHATEGHTPDYILPTGDEYNWRRSFWRDYLNDLSRIVAGNEADTNIESIADSVVKTPSADRRERLAHIGSWVWRKLPGTQENNHRDFEYDRYADRGLDDTLDNPLKFPSYIVDCIDGWEYRHYNGWTFKGLSLPNDSIDIRTSWKYFEQVARKVFVCTPGVLPEAGPIADPPNYVDPTDATPPPTEPPLPAAPDRRFPCYFGRPTPTRTPTGVWTPTSTPTRTSTPTVGTPQATPTPTRRTATSTPTRTLTPTRERTPQATPAPTPTGMEPAHYPADCFPVVHFQTNDFDLLLSPESLAGKTVALDATVNCMRADPTLKVVVCGYADARGIDRKNNILSENRARSAASYLDAQLESHEVASKRIRLVACGKPGPDRTSRCSDRRACNEAVWENNRRAMILEDSCAGRTASKCCEACENGRFVEWP